MSQGGPVNVLLILPTALCLYSSQSAASVLLPFGRSASPLPNHLLFDCLFLLLQRLGIKVIRIWGFNDKLPSAPGKYDEGQFRGLDQVIAAAEEKNIRLVIAIGNLWPHYKGPENWLQWADGSAAGKTILDFYK